MGRKLFCMITGGFELKFTVLNLASCNKNISQDKNDIPLPLQKRISFLKFHVPYFLFGKNTIVRIHHRLQLTGLFVFLAHHVNLAACKIFIMKLKMKGTLCRNLTACLRLISLSISYFCVRRRYTCADEISIGD